MKSSQVIILRWQEGLAYQRMVILVLNPEFIVVNRLCGLYIDRFNEAMFRTSFAPVNIIVKYLPWAFGLDKHAPVRHVTHISVDASYCRLVGSVPPVAHALNPAAHMYPV